MTARPFLRRACAFARNALGGALAALVVLVVAPDAAAIPRTFVASFGKDSNDCSLPSPCRGFTAALALTDPGGEIVVLDSAGYGAVTIGKSVSIIVPAGIYAGVSVFSGDGISIAGIGINVTLQGLTINGQGGVHGVRFVQGSRLNVAGCDIKGMNGNGVRVEGAGTVVVTRTSIIGSAQEGVFVNAAAKVSIVRSRIQSSGGHGIEFGGGASGSVVRTLVANSGLFGIEARAGRRRRDAHRDRRCLGHRQRERRRRLCRGQRRGRRRAHRCHEQPHHAELQRGLRVFAGLGDRCGQRDEQ